MSDFKRVDGGWKERVENERRKLQDTLDRGSPARQLPPASFMTVLSTFATQAMVALGETEVPGVDGRSVDLDAARFTIDSLDVLRQKTAGNLSEVERKTLEQILQDLRLRFVARTKEEEEKGPASALKP
jgi:hypothetical protein